MAERDATAEQQLAADSPSEFCIFIKTLRGKTFAVPVSLDDTVWELKVKLNAQDSSLTPETGRLLYNSRQMEEDLNLRHYEITPNCFLYHTLILRGGGGAVKPGFSVIDLALMKNSAGPHKSLTDEALGSAKKSYHRLNLGSLPRRNCWRCMGESLPEVTPEITQDFLEYHTVYHAHLPGAGIFQCSITGLSFEVKLAVTVTYRYATWTRHLSEADQETWVPAGPLFHIEVQPGVMQAVHLPHFICLAEDVNTGLCSIAHFKSGKLTLERPTRLIAFSAVLENPSFSLLGVLWRRLRSTLNSLPMHSMVLIFQQLSAADTTLHLYLIPDDNSVKQAIEKQEMDWNSKLIPKPPPFNPLFFGCIYHLTSTNSVVIMPEAHLPFCYKSPKEQQLFVEIYIGNMAEEIGLLMTDTRNDTVVWRALLRSDLLGVTPVCEKTPRTHKIGARPDGPEPAFTMHHSSIMNMAHSKPADGDMNLPACISKTLSGATFMKKHKTKLCSRMRQFSTVLLHLWDANVINSDEEEEVQGQDTCQRRNRVLLELAEKKGLEAQEQLYKILKMKDPYLIADLEKSS